MLRDHRAAALQRAPGGWEQDVAQQQGAAGSSRAVPAMPPGAAAAAGPGGAAAAGRSVEARCLGDMRFAVTFGFIAVAAFFRSVLGSPSEPHPGGGASWADHAALAGYAVCCALLAGLAAGSAAYRRPGVRSAVIAALRLAAFLGADRMIHLTLLDVPPHAGPVGPLVDAVHVALGSESVKLFLFSTFLPLPLPAQLVVCTLTLVCPMRFNPQSCGLQLMSSPPWVARVAAFHGWLSVGAMGILPAGFPGAAPAQCVAALAFSQLLLGWLLPLFLVARASWQAAQGRGGEPRRRPSLDARLACWLLEEVFLAGAPGGLPVLAWGILLTLAWMAAGLVALALAG